MSSLSQLNEIDFLFKKQFRYENLVAVLWSPVNVMNEPLLFGFNFHVDPTLLLRFLKRGY